MLFETIANKIIIFFSTKYACAFKRKQNEFSSNDFQCFLTSLEWIRIHQPHSSWVFYGLVSLEFVIYCEIILDPTWRNEKNMNNTQHQKTKEKYDFYEHHTSYFLLISVVRVTYVVAWKHHVYYCQTALQTSLLFPRHHWQKPGTEKRKTNHLILSFYDMSLIYFFIPFNWFTINSIKSIENIAILLYSTALIIIWR